MRILPSLETLLGTMGRGILQQNRTQAFAPASNIRKKNFVAGPGKLEGPSPNQQEH